MARAYAMFGVPFALSAALFLLPAPATSNAVDGAKIFKKCAACHTATGAGVPGSFPPLRGDFRRLAGQPQGRRYLQLALIKGVSGPITVEGKAYRSVMPAQVLDDASVAAVLNHVGTNVAKTGPKFKPFTAAEVKTVRSGAGSLNAGAVAKLRPAGGK